MTERRSTPGHRPTRTCVGCGRRDDATAMVRLVVDGDEVAFDALFRRRSELRRGGGAFGRGAHVHARPDCLARAPRGIARSFARAARVDAPELGRRLQAACDRRMAGLLLAARRARVLAVGADAATQALRQDAPLVIVAIDAGGVARTAEVQRAVAEGRAVAWKTKYELGALLGQQAVAMCAVRHAGIANELKTLCAAADAGARATREGGECSIVPEAR